MVFTHLIISQKKALDTCPIQVLARKKCIANGIESTLASLNFFEIIDYSLSRPVSLLQMQLLRDFLQDILF
ncbi:MAG: hypothetical protein CMQ27_00100 [Gammaproteobacteria bacterium]|nr:hypothetical protein [Gammaproteobacteria bacterium]